MTPNFDKTIADGGIAYHRCGHGPALLLIHGVGLRAESWYPLVTSLAEHFELIVIDLPGHGDSRGLDRCYETVKFDDYFRSITQFIRSIGLQEYLVCGHSLGALLAVECASNQQNKVLGLVALNTVFQRDNAATDAVKKRAKDLSNSDAVTGVEQTIERWFTSSPTTDMLPHAQACEYWLSANSVDGYAMAYKTFADQVGPSPESLDRINCGSIFMTGELDSNSSPTMSRLLSSHTTQSVVEVVEGAGHMMPLTHSHVVIRALLNFKQRGLGN